jgi:nucleoside phosphorylase
METIGLIAAMTQESDALLRCVKEWRQISLGSLHGKRFEQSGRTCLLVTSGMGVRRAEEAARNLIAMFSPRILISFGIAGAVEADLQVGDVVMAKVVYWFEQGVTGRCLPLSTWPEAVQEASVQVLSQHGARLWTGTAVTTRGSQVMANQLRKLRHPILEMETFGIAQVAAEKGIPFFSIRAISDGPRSPIQFDLGEMMDEYANLKGSKVLTTIVRHPRLVFQSRRLIRNTRIAADNAAIALFTALSQPPCTTSQPTS